MGSNSPIFKEEQLDKAEVEFISLSQIFEQACPIYMSYGMSYDEYWYDDCYKAKYYRDAYEIQIKHKDEEFWIQGMYIYDALCRVSPVLHAFSKSGTKPLPYPNKPYSLLLDEKKKTEEEKEKEVENARLIAQLHFDAWARSVGKRFKNKDNAQ